MARRFITIALLGWLMTATAGAADEAPEAPPHCGFLNGLAQFDLGLRTVSTENAGWRDHLAAASSRLRHEIRETRIAAAFSELEVLRIEAYLAAQQRAIRQPGDGATALHHARAQHPLPWNGPALAQNLALCGVEGGSVRPIETGAGTGDQDGKGGDPALTGQLRLGVGSATLQADIFALLILAIATLCLMLVLRELVGENHRRSRRVYCYVPVIYSAGPQMRMGWLLDLSSHGCKLQTQGESWPVGTKLRIGVGDRDLIGTVAWTNRYYAGVDLRHQLDPVEVDRIAFGGTTSPLAAE